MSGKNESSMMACGVVFGGVGIVATSWRELTKATKIMATLTEEYEEDFEAIQATWEDPLKALHVADLQRILSSIKLKKSREARKEQNA